MKTFRWLIALMLMIVCLCSTALAAGGVYQLGDKIEDFTFTTYDGETMSLYDILEEKDAVLLNFWATWCSPCRREFPFMEEAYRQYSDKVEIVALSVEPTDTNDVLADFADQMGLTFRVGQENAGIASRFNTASIPVTVMVDRFGTICFQKIGSLPGASSFTRLFDVFIGENYTESMILQDIPEALPNVAPSSEEELSAALNVEGGSLVFSNSANIMNWPMVVGEKDGRSVVKSSNTGIDSTHAWIDTVINAKAGDAVAVTFKISSFAGMDLMYLIVNDEVVKCFGGEDGWMTYAHAFETDGNYNVSVLYGNTPGYSAGEDALWVDSIAHLTGDDAAAALAANPVYPTADEMFIKPLNESARQIVINDPTGVFAELLSNAEYYIIPEDVASFELGLPAGEDPEWDMVVCNFDGSQQPVIDSLKDGKYIVTTGVDAYATTGNYVSKVSLYATEKQELVYFKDIENLEIVIAELTQDQNGNVLGSWSYADEAAPTAAPVTSLTEAAYVIKYVDQHGNPVPGVMCQVCDESTCQVFVSDASGICEFTLAPYAWEIHTLKAPEGYSADNDVVIAPVEGGELVLTLTKN